MELVDRTALIVRPEQPYIDWAISFEEGCPKYDQDPIMRRQTLDQDRLDPFWRQQYSIEFYAFLSYYGAENMAVNRISFLTCLLR